MLRYGGGLIGPLAIGWVLDLSGGMSRVAWGLAWATVAALMVLALIAFLYIRPNEVSGERAF